MLTHTLGLRNHSCPAHYTSCSVHTHITRQVFLCTCSSANPHTRDHNPHSPICQRWASSASHAVLWLAGRALVWDKGSGLQAGSCGSQVQGLVHGKATREGRSLRAHSSLTLRQRSNYLWTSCVRLGETLSHTPFPPEVELKTWSQSRELPAGPSPVLFPASS